MNHLGDSGPKAPPFRPRSTLLGRHWHGQGRCPAGSHAHGSVDDPLPIRELQERVGWHTAPLGLQRELVSHPAGFRLDNVHRPQAVRRDDDDPEGGELRG